MMGKNEAYPFRKYIISRGHVVHLTEKRCDTRDVLKVGGDFPNKPIKWLPRRGIRFSFVTQRINPIVVIRK